MTLIADDPTVRCMERTGYPPWMVYGGKNDEEEQETEHLLPRGKKSRVPKAVADEIERSGRAADIFYENVDGMKNTGN